MVHVRRSLAVVMVGLAGTQAWGVDLHPGDILISVNNTIANKITRIDPVTGKATDISSGGQICQPKELVLGPDNEIFVLDNCIGGTGVKGIVEINPETGEQTVIRTLGKTDVSVVHGLALDSNGDFFVSDWYWHRLIRIDESNNVTVVSANGLLVKPVGLCLDPVTGDLLVAAAGEYGEGADGKIVRVDPMTGQQTVISEGGFLVDPEDVVVGPGLQLYVVDGESLENSFGQVLRIDPLTGEQTRLDLVQVFGPIAVAIGLDDMVVTADPGPFTGSGKVQRLSPFVPGAPEDLITSINFHPIGITVVASPCPWDCDGSGDANANVADLLTLLSQWDSLSPNACNGGSCDFNLSGCTDVQDLLMLLAHYTPDPAGAGCP